MKKVLSLVLVLAMVLGSFSFVSAASNDVVGTVYEEAVARLSLLGILTGYEDGSFKPENQITRAEFAAVAIRAKGLEPTAQAAKGLATGFSDVPAGHWASGYVGTAAKMGIVNGVGNGQFAPEAPVKYEEAITMLVRALGYEEAAKQKGGYPYGYLIVANENGLLDEVKGTQGAPALRGTVAQLVDNALEIPMMIQVGFGANTKWVVSGSKEHGDDAEERYLLDEMGFDSVKGRVVSVSPKTDKLTVDPTDEDKKNVTLKVGEGFDFYAVEGLETKFWYKNETVVVGLLYEEAKFDAVEYDADEKELTLITEDENYEVAKDAYLEIDGEKVKIDKFEADYAKIVLNDDDEIVWAQGYTLDGFILVEEVKDNVAYSYDEYDEVKIKDFLVVKDGKTIGIDGIEEGDILFFNVDEKFAAVSNKGTEGELDRVYTDGTFRFEGAGYGKSDIGAPIYFDENKVGELDADVLKDFLDDEAKITVYVDFAGDVVVVAGEVSSVGNSAYGVLLNDVNEYEGRKGSMVALDLRNGANEKVSYDIISADLGDDIKLVGKITPENFIDEEVKAGTVLKLTVDKDGDVTGIELPESVKLGKDFDLDDENAKDVDGYSYKLQASTVVFYDNNKKATTIGNAKDAFKEVKAGATIYFEKGRVVAVVGETDADADTKDVTGLVTGVKEVKGGKLQFTVKVFGTTERLVTESKTLKESAYTKYVDNIVTFKVGETSNEIKDEKDSIKFAGSKTITITKISGRTISSKEYTDVELNTKAKIYDADLDEINLRDLKKDMVITVYFQGNSKTFIDYVTVGAVGGGKTEETGLIKKSGTGSDLDPYAITVDDSDPYFLNAKTVLRNADGKVIATGAASVWAALTNGDKVEVTVKDDIMTIKRLATAGEIDGEKDLAAAKKALNEAIDAADELKEADYETETWKALKAALAMPEKDITEINKKSKAINDAIKLLEFAGMQDLKDKIAEVKDLNKDDYEPISWNEFSASLSLANAIVLRPRDNAEVVKATNELKAASVALVFAGQEALDEAKAEADGKVEAEYTEESWTQFQTDLEAALKMTEKTNQEVLDKTAAINAAIAKLAAKGEVQDYTLKVGINEINNSVNIAGGTINDNVEIVYNATADLYLPTTLNITGNLTVTAPKATVNNSAKVGGTITIKDVKSGTWNENVSVNTLVFEAAGKTLKITDGVAGLTIKANATVITPKAVNAVVANGVIVTVKANATISDDEAVKITGTVSTDPVPLNPVAPNQEQEAPTGLEGVAPATADNNDGKITGTTTTMEYRLKDTGEFTAVTGTEITRLAAGTYEVRYAAKEGYNAGEVTEVVVPAYVALEPTTYTVTFNSNGGSEVAAITVEENKTIELPEEPTREGFIFVGWYTDDTTFANKFTVATQVTTNVTVHAKWEEDTSALEIAALGAKTYIYDPVYNYNYVSLDIDGNVATISYNQSAVTDNPNILMNDLARYLGALYRFDNGTTVKSIGYSDSTYNWVGTLKGSNWKTEDASLVGVITAQFVANPETFNEITLTLRDVNNNSIDLTLKFVIIEE